MSFKCNIYVMTHAASPQLTVQSQFHLTNQLKPNHPAGVSAPAHVAATTARAQFMRMLMRMLLVGQPMLRLMLMHPVVAATKALPPLEAPATAATIAIEDVMLVQSAQLMGMRMHRVVAGPKALLPPEALTIATTGAVAGVTMIQQRCSVCVAEA